MKNNSKKTRNQDLWVIKEILTIALIFSFENNVRWGMPVIVKTLGFCLPTP
jgi:hypothetical protein